MPIVLGWNVCQPSATAEEGTQLQGVILVRFCIALLILTDGYVPLVQ